MSNTSGTNQRLFYLINEHVQNKSSELINYLFKSKELLLKLNSDDIIYKFLNSFFEFTNTYIFQNVFLNNEINNLLIKIFNTLNNDEENTKIITNILSTIILELKQFYHDIINEIINFDTKMNKQINNLIDNKLNEFLKQIFNIISIKQQSKDNNTENKNKLSRYEVIQNKIFDNIHKFKTNINKYLQPNNVFLKLCLNDFKTLIEEIKSIDITKFKNLNLDIVIKEIKNINNISYILGPDENYIFFKIKIHYPLIEISNKLLIGIIAFNIDKVTNNYCLNFIKNCIKLLKYENDQVIKEIASIKTEIKTELFDIISTSFSKFESIPIFFDKIIEILHNHSNAYCTLFLCADDNIVDYKFTRIYGFLKEYKSLVENNISNLKQKVISNISNLTLHQNNTKKDLTYFLFNEPYNEWLNLIINEFKKYDINYQPYEVLIVPLMYEDILKGCLMFFSHNNKTISYFFEQIVSIINNHIINVFCNFVTYFKLNEEYKKFDEKIEKIVESEKIKLVAAISTGLAHNFNNLIAIVLGHVGLLQNELKDKKLLSSLNIIEETLKNGTDIIQRLQAFIPKKQLYGFQLIDLNEILHYVIDITKMRIEAEKYLKNISINVVEKLSPLPKTLINIDEFQQAILNVAFNAVEAMPNGGTITFETFSYDETIFLKIKDTGIGMSNEIKQKVFTPFFTTKGQIGTGLSLSYTYGVILNHKGNILIDSTVGKGTEVLIKLPIITSIDSNFQTNNQKSYPKCKILVIDDNEAVRIALAEMLKTLGHTVVETNCGKEAIKILKNDQTFNILVTDLKMPEFSGFDVIKIAKKTIPNIIAIIVTAYTYNLDELDDKDRLLIDAIIGKPFNLSTIESTINAALNKKNKSENF